MTAHQGALVAVTAVFVACSWRVAAFELRDARRNGRRWTPAIAAACVAAILALRLALVSPSFVHANFHAVALLDAVFAFPNEAAHRSEYGQFGFLVLGAIAAAFGRTFETVCVANQVFAVLALGALAALAARLTARPAAGAAALALGALHPALLRVAASEDAHNLAVLLGAAALLAVDVYVERQSCASLVAAACALALMINTRQTFYLFVPCALALALTRGSREILRRRSFIAAALLVTAALAIRLAATLGSRSDMVTLRTVPVLLVSPAVIGWILRFNPLLDVVRFGPVGTILLLVGLVRCASRAGDLRGLAGAFLFVFVTTLPFGFPTPGVEFGFRMPALALGLVVEAVGAAWLLEHARRWPVRRWTGRAARTAPFALLAAAPIVSLLTPGWASARTLSADFEEYRFVRSVAPALPQDIVLVRIPAQEPAPAYALPKSAFDAISFRVVESGSLGRSDFSRPVLFLAGVQCFAYSLGELAGIDANSARAAAPDVIRRLAPVTFGRELGSPLLLPPPGMRAECESLLTGATPIGPSGAIVHPTQDVPFALFREDPVPLQLYRLAAPP